MQIPSEYNYFNGTCIYINIEHHCSYISCILLQTKISQRWGELTSCSQSHSENRFAKCFQYFQYFDIFFTVKISRQSAKSEKVFCYLAQFHWLKNRESPVRMTKYWSLKKDGGSFVDNSKIARGYIFNGMRCYNKWWGRQRRRKIQSWVGSC